MKMMVVVTMMMMIFFGVRPNLTEPKVRSLVPGFEYISGSLLFSDSGIPAIAAHGNVESGQGLGMGFRTNL